MAIPNHIIKRIEDQIDIVEVVSRYVALERKGDRYWGCCPFHLEKTPSFSVSPSRGSFYCFGCKKSGGIFQFIMEIEKIGFVEAVHQFANQLGILIDEADEKGEENFQEKKALLLLYQRIIKTFEHCLWNTPDGQLALQYLQNRGLSENTIRHYHIGYAPQDKFFLYNFLHKRGYSGKILAKSGLFSKKYPQFPFFLNRILFPVFQNTGEVIAFSGRLIKESDNGGHSPKYLNSPDTIIYNKKQHLFGFYQAKKTINEQGFMLCEGAMDVCAMYEMGYQGAVASLGTGFTNEQARLLKRISEKGYIIFDNDEAGEKAKKAAIFILEKVDIQPKIVNLEEEKDPGEILQKKNLKGLQKSIDSARIPIEFLIDITARPMPQNAIEAVGVCQAIFEYIQSISSPVIQDEMLRILASRLNLKEGAVAEEFQRFNKKSTHRVIIGENKETQNLPPSKSLYQLNGTVYELLRIFLEHPQCYQQYGRAIQKRWLNSHESQLVASYLENDLDKISFSLWLEEQSSFDENIKHYLLQPLYFEHDVEQYVQIMLKQLEVKDLERECSNLADMIKRAEKRGDSEESVNDLIKDYVLVVQELQQLKAGL